LVRRYLNSFLFLSQKETKDIVKMSYKFLEHTADVKFQAEGKTIEEAFTEAAMALKETILKGKTKIAEKVKKRISVDGKDKESLLYNFLEEFLFLLDSERFVLSKIDKIKIDKNNLIAEVSGDMANRYKISNDVKAVTYNSMFVKKDKNKFIIQAVLEV